jgi:hypothetical protein
MSRQLGIQAVGKITLLYVVLGSSFVFGQYGGGSGDPNDPFQIGTTHHLINLRNDPNNWDKHFSLTADLDLAGVNMIPVGNAAVPFSGTFDGGGHTISNLTISLPDSESVGFFGVVDNVIDPNTIFDLGLINSSVTGEQGVGALAGKVEHGGILRCFSKGGAVNGASAGGLMGISHGQVTDCYSTTPLNVPSMGARYIYWTDNGNRKIQRSRTDGTAVEDLVNTDPDLPSGLALDFVQGKMYWTLSFVGKIQRANLDGSEVETLVTTGPNHLIDIALDTAAGKMYWTDMFNHKIQRANLDGSNVEDLITVEESSFPLGIALDVTAGRMYWSSSGSPPKIQRANLDGSNIEGLIIFSGLSSHTTPSGIALDLAAGKMYWTDWSLDKIERANLDGTESEVLVTGSLAGPFGIALDIVAGKMYWADANVARNIQRANMDGTFVEDLITTGLDSPAYIDLESGTLNCGAFVGINLGSIIRCYAAGIVNGTFPVGGFVGKDSSGSYKHCFWDNIVNVGLPDIGFGSDPNVIGKSTNNLQTEETFTNVGWDFVGVDINGTEDIWTICEGTNYPKLSWQHPLPGDTTCPDGVAIEDLLSLSQEWLQQGATLPDYAPNGGDGVFNLPDFASLSQNWMEGT